jgi:hypothetical protein
MTFRHDPLILDLAKFIHNGRATANEHVLSFLKNVDRRWPSLSFRDFLAAMHLADLVARESGGHA